jgi:hypothetical protein
MVEDFQSTPSTFEDARGDTFQLNSEINKDREGWILDVPLKPVTRLTIPHEHNACALSRARRGVVTWRLEECEPPNLPPGPAQWKYVGLGWQGRGKLQPIR